MATNVDRLRVGLDAYRDSLARHLARLADDFASVQDCWAALDQEYEGQAAEEFRQRWGATADWFKQYETALHGMIAMIDERTPHLGEL